MGVAIAMSVRGLFAAAGLLGIFVLSVIRRYVSVRVVCAWMRSSRAGLTKLQMATQAPPPAKLEVRFFRVAFTSGRALPRQPQALSRGKRDNNAFSNSCPRPN